MDTIAERVARGAGWLDATAPGWPERIDLGRLDLASPCLCVLGQVFEEAAKADEYDDGYDWAKNDLGADAVFLGFDLTMAEASEKAWQEIDAEWRALIAGRRVAA
jgi:hypothetical protein